MVIALKEEQFFEPKIFEKWIVLNRKIDSFQEVDFTLSTNNVQELVKDEKLKSFVLKSVFDIENYELSDIEKFKQKLLLELLLSTKTYCTTQMDKQSSLPFI